jgi:cytochrome b561
VSDQLFGFVLVGIGILFVLALVFAISLRMGSGGPQAPAKPPRGVHMPAPSFLPVLISLAVILIGAGLAMRGDYVPFNPWIAIPGLVLLVAVIVAWVRAAGHEWHDVEQGPHHDEVAEH